MNWNRSLIAGWAALAGGGLLGVLWFESVLDLMKGVAPPVLVLAGAAAVVAERAESKRLRSERERDERSLPEEPDTDQTLGKESDAR